MLYELVDTVSKDDLSDFQLFTTGSNMIVQQYYLLNKYMMQDMHETPEKANDTKKLHRSLVLQSRYNQCEER